MDSNERRHYQRSDHFNIVAKMSRDGRRWKKVFIHNISSGGFQFSTDDKFEPDDEMWFDLSVQGFFSEFQIKCKGRVQNVKIQEGRFIYGVNFMHLSPDIKILIDENIKSDRPIGGDPYLSDL